MTLGSSGNVLSALVSSSLERLSSALRRHTLSESVHLASLTLLGLIRSLHFFVHLPIYGFTDGHRHRSGARRVHMPLPVRRI